MGVPNRQIGWSQESNLLWYILSQLKRLTSVIFSLKEAATPKYKVFTALLTQSGNDDPYIITTPESLVIGKSYKINGYVAGDDFTNVGAPSNAIDVWFVATGTTPAVWTSSELFTNGGAPVATVLENTVGDVWFEYSGIGSYAIRSESLFIVKKTGVIMATPYNNGDPTEPRVYTTKIDSEDLITLYTFAINLTPRDNSLDYTFIEIRVYN